MKEKKIRPKFPEYTSAFYNSILIPKTEVFKGIEDRNRIKTIPILILGLPGSGKSVFANNILKKLKDYYGGDSINAIYSNSSKLGTLIHVAFRHGPFSKKPIQLLVFDDATSVKISPLEFRRFFSLRHEMEEQTGLKEGVIYSVYMSHEWFALNKLFRRVNPRVVALTAPTIDDYARHHAERMLGKEAIEKLTKIWMKAEKYDEYKGTGIVKLPYAPDSEHQIGMIHWKDLPSEGFFELVIKPEMDQEVMVDLIKAKIYYKEVQETAEQILVRKREQDAARQRALYERKKNQAMPAEVTQNLT